MHAHCLCLCGTAAGSQGRKLDACRHGCFRELHTPCTLQDLEIQGSHTLAAESLASMPMSLQRLVLNHCPAVPASSLASLGRLTALEQLALDCLPNAGGDDAMQQLAPQLHARLTSLDFNGFSGWKVGAESLDRAMSFVSLGLPAMPCTFSGWFMQPVLM